MDHHQFDSTLIRAAMARAETVGWRRVTIVEAARQAGLPLDEARERFPARATVLLRLGLLADRAALVDEGNTGTVREQLFDMLMRRIDVLQQYRGGMQSVLRALPFDPALALLVSAATLDSMRWIGAAAGVDTAGFVGMLRAQGLVAVWLQTVRAWDKDDGEDLSSTMAALDKALDRADRAARMSQRPLFDHGTKASDPGTDVTGTLSDEMPGEPDVPFHST